MDNETTIIELRHAVEAFVKARNWSQFHTAKNLAMSVAIEAAELMEQFQWLTADESAQFMKDATFKANVADELADVLIYCLSLANHTDIDISHAVLKKLERNESRFLPREFKSGTE